VSTDASDQRGFENAQPQQVRQARTFACAIEPEIVTRILTVGVVERVVRVPLVVERADPRTLESGAEGELPAERGLAVEGERSG
ncbi:MAG TPA: hypothetical protein VM925_00785, partial [Labilithrix sp.]|nr:hypothetical protein [Labilithrix sp.]